MRQCRQVFEDYDEPGKGLLLMFFCLEWGAGMGGLQGSLLLWPLLRQWTWILTIHLCAWLHSRHQGCTSEPDREAQLQWCSQLGTCYCSCLRKEILRVAVPEADHWTLDEKDRCPFLPVVLRVCSEWEQTPGTDDVTLAHHEYSSWNSPAAHGEVGEYIWAFQPSRCGCPWMPIWFKDTGSGDIGANLQGGLNEEIWRLGQTPKGLKELNLRKISRN